MTQLGKLVGILFALLLVVSTAASLVYAAGFASVTAFWTANDDDSLTIDSGQTATAHITVISDRNFDLTFQVWNRDTDELVSQRTFRNIPSAVDSIYSRDFSVPQDIQLPTNHKGNYDIKVLVLNQNGASAQTSLSLSVRNSAPSIVAPSTVTAEENQLLTFTIRGTDVDGDRLSLITSGLPSGANVIPVNAEAGLLVAELRWIPTFSQAGTYPVQFSVTDGTATTIHATTITVRNNVAHKLN